MTELLFRADPYLREAEAVVVGHTAEGGILCDRSLFYPTGGGQPGDSGWLDWAGGGLPIATAVKAEGGQVALVPAAPDAMPSVGTVIRQRLDWDRRHRHMRVHTALHLLSVVIPLPVTGGQIGAERGRLDFDMPDPPDDVALLQGRLNALRFIGDPSEELKATALRWIDGISPEIERARQSLRLCSCWPDALRASLTRL